MNHYEDVDSIITGNTSLEKLHESLHGMDLIMTGNGLGRPIQRMSE